MMIGKYESMRIANSPKEQCVYFQEDCCKFDNKKRHCSFCDIRVDKDDVVNKSSLSKELRELIEESHGRMLFIENDNTDYSDETLQHMMDEIILSHPLLSEYIDIDATRTGDALITVYEGAYYKII